jgi:hypothetical protein
MTPDLSKIYDVLTIAAEHLMQYRRYSEAMRAIGRGCALSSPYSEGLTDRLISEALADLRSARPASERAYHARIAEDLNSHIANHEA